MSRAGSIGLITPSAESVIAGKRKSVDTDGSLGTCVVGGSETSRNDERLPLSDQQWKSRVMSGREGVAGIW